MTHISSSNFGNYGQASGLDRCVPQLLLAEDDDELRVLLCEWLEDQGYAVTAVRDGFELLEAVARHVSGEKTFRGVVSDIRMPGPEGMFALATLREEDNAVPVILTTAFGDEATKLEAVRLGALAVLDKPLDLDALGRLLTAELPVLPATDSPHPQGPRGNQ